MTKIYDGSQRINVSRPSTEYVEIDVQDENGKQVSVRLGKISLKNLVRALLQFVVGD